MRNFLRPRRHFPQTPTTETQQDALHNSVMEQDLSIRAQGIDLVAFGPQITTGQEVAQVVNLTPSQQSELDEEFGPNFTAENVSASQVAVPFDRENDSSPWNGGDFITNDTNTDCSSGIPAHNSGGGYYLITAAHCFPLGTDIYNGSITIPWGTFDAMSFIAAADFSNDGLDAELDAPYSSDLLYTGPSVNAARSVISGTATSPVGYQVCDDGAFEGEYCGLTIQSNNNCLWIAEDNRYACHIVLADGTNDQDAGQGDSGGPVFRFSGSSLLVTGTITGGTGTFATCTNWYPQTDRLCSNDLYYTNVNNELAEWGLIVN